MRTTLALDDDLVRIAQEFTGVAEKTALIREALKALIERESARRLASLGGTMPGLKKFHAANRAKPGCVRIDSRRHVRLDRHLRSGNQEMRQHLDQGQIVIHPFIIAELALGSLRERTRMLALLDLLPHVRVAQISEVRLTIEARRLYSLGIGLTDAHLIASVLINSPTLLWTRDKRLGRPPKALAFTPTWLERQKPDSYTKWVPHSCAFCAQEWETRKRREAG